MQWISTDEAMPEDRLPLHKYKMWGKDRRCTPYVAVVREHRERIDCAKRVEINGKWCWTDGDGITKETHWASYERPPWNEKAHQEYCKQLALEFKRNSKGK